MSKAAIAAIVVGHVNRGRCSLNLLRGKQSGPVTSTSDASRMDDGEKDKLYWDSHCKVLRREDKTKPDFLLKNNRREVPNLYKTT